MTLEQLRIFTAVAERLHFTRAAEGLGLTQSAVSAAIAALETRSGILLFHRLGRRVELTAEGAAFLGEARAVLGRAADAKAMLDDLAGLTRGSLRVFASQTVAAYWLPSRLHRFRQSLPGIDLAMMIGNTAEAVAAMLDGAVDLAVVEGPVDSPELEARPVAEDNLLLVVGGQYRRLSGLGAGPNELRRLPWVLREPGSGTRAACEELLASRGLGLGDVEVALELPGNEAVRAAVEAGAGATVLSRLIIGASLDLGTLSAIPCGLPPRRFSAVSHRQRHLSRAARAFLDLLP